MALSLDLRRLILALIGASLLVATLVVPSLAAAASLNVSWPTEREYRVGAQIRVEVDYDSDSAGQLRLERNDEGSWATQTAIEIAAGTSSIHRFTIPSESPGSFTYRIVLDAGAFPLVSQAETFSFRQVPPEPTTYATVVRMSSPVPGRTTVPSSASPVVRGVVTSELPGQAGVQGRTVRIMLSTPRRDVPLVSVLTEKDGGFTARLPHGFAYRGEIYASVAAAKVSRDGAILIISSGSSPRRRVAVTLGRSGVGMSGAYKLTQGAGAWSSCRSLTYRVNLSRAPRGFLAVTKRAMEMLYQSTGLRFVYAGSTRAIPGAQGRRNSDPRSPMVITWSDGKSVEDLRDSLIGIAYTSSSGVGKNATIESSGIVLDLDNNLEPGFGPGPSHGELLLHELGHAVGLDHVADQRQIMHVESDGGPDLFQAGDLAGLTKVGVMSGCEAVSDRRPSVTYRRARH